VVTELIGPRTPNRSGGGKLAVMLQEGRGEWSDPHRGRRKAADYQRWASDGGEEIGGGRA
jgi:hypothetical protein